MKILSAIITRTAVSIEWKNDNGKQSLDLRDAPLPAFPNAIAALAPLVCLIIHAPAKYTTGLRVLGIKMDEQGGAPTVSISARKSFDDAAKEMKVETPPRLMIHPTEPGTYTPPLDEGDKDLINEVLEQAKAYIRGERAQGTLPLETPEDTEKEAAAEPQSGDVLDFPDTGDAGHEEEADDADDAPAKKPRKKAK